MRTVRTTLFPDRVLEVDDAEYTDLSRQGLLLPEPPPATAVWQAPDVAVRVPRDGEPTEPASPATLGAPASPPEGG